jgi:uncharacterized protein YjiS (DUF1127 family)
MMKSTRIYNPVAAIELDMARAATDVDNVSEHSTNAMVWESPAQRHGLVTAHFRRIVRTLFARGLDALRSWQHRSRERCDLLSLSERLLRDIGLSRAVIERERANRSGAPKHQPLNRYWYDALGLRKESC